MRRSTSVILWAIGLPLLAVALLKIVEQDPGIAIFSGALPIIGEFYFAVTFSGLILFAALGFIIAYLITRLVIRVIRLPKSLGSFSQRRREARANRHYSRGELALLENNPQRAESFFLSAAEGNANPHLCYLGAAKAAHLQKNEYRRDQYLKQIEFADDRKNRRLAEIKRGEFLIEIGAYEKAEELLAPLNQKRKDNNIILLLATIYHKLGKLSALEALLPDFVKAMRKEPNQNVALPLYCDLLEYAAKEDNLEHLNALYKQLPREVKEEEKILLQYASLLLKVGEGDEAEAALRRGLRRGFNETLMLAYGQLYRGNLPAQIRHARRLVERFADQPTAHLALAQLLLRANNLAEAEQAVKSALSLDSNLANAYKVLGEIKLAQEDEKGALLAFRKTNQILLPDRPEGVKEVDGELIAPSATEKITHQKEAEEGDFTATHHSADLSETKTEERPS